VLPWKNPRWIKAFAAILFVDGAIVFGVARFAQINPLTVLACVVILTDIGIFVWFRQSAFWSRAALRNALMVHLGGGIILAGSWILYEKSGTSIALLLILIVFLTHRIWGRPLLKKLQAENEKSHPS
jgi:hypothetical protein